MVGSETHRRLRSAWELARSASLTVLDQEWHVAFDWDNSCDGGDQVDSVEGSARRHSCCDNPVNRAADIDSNTINQGRLVPVPCGHGRSFVHLRACS